MIENAGNYFAQLLKNAFAPFSEDALAVLTPRTLEMAVRV